jgi:chromosome segregation ATPase
VAELEARLEDVRTERLRMSEGAQTLKEALEPAGIENEIAIQAKLGAIQNEISDIAAKLEAARASTDRLRTHAVDHLRGRGRTVAHELEAVENAIRDVEEVIADAVYIFS